MCSSDLDAVVAAVREGQFHIYAVNHVDEALYVLSGVEAGSADADNNFPEDSINAQVVARLRSIAEIDLDDDEEKSSN